MTLDDLDLPADILAEARRIADDLDMSPGSSSSLSSGGWQP
ncbi:hypothetical protein [Methylobacterium sp. WL18]|nr:hypothetical protein [Methylobacterium sp. WL18]